MMETIRLPGTELTVSRLCMGTANFGASLDQQQVSAHLDAFLAHGGNLIDTAHVYCNWLPVETSCSEKMIGRWLKERRREDVILCTKGGHYDLRTPDVSRVTPECLRQDLEESLRCLQTEYIDIYMLHRDNPALPVEVIMDCLAAFVAEGKVRCLACSNWTAARTAQANACAARRGQPGFVVNELMWSMARINRDTLPADYVVMDEDMMALGQATGLSFMAFTSLAKGYLTRRWRGDPIPDGLRRTYDNPENDQLLRRLAPLGSAAEVTQASLRYFARQRVTAIPIVSFSGMAQLEECMGAFE
ncbi:MAG: aldo/keto reductase [Aristaeellaceae bacterium]